MKEEEIVASIKERAVNIFSEEGLLKRLKSGKQLRIKLGADPSRPDLHLGHSVLLRQLKKLQDMGHKIVFIIGDFTAMIGDPSGKSKTRPNLSYEETRKNGETYFQQVGKILDVSKTEIRYNAEWLQDMNFGDVIKLASKYTVARMLERDDFANRFANKTPISMHELLYPLVQGYDSVAIESDIEVGGTDQTFNLLVGRDLQKDYGQDPQEVITFPLLVGLDGKEKMSKSLDNYIGICEDAGSMFLKCMKVPDSVLLDYFVLTTDYSTKEATEIIEKDIVEAHRIYARTIVTMYHNAEECKLAEERYNTISSGALPTELVEVSVGAESATVIQMLMASKLASSTSEARRLVQGNGVKVNNAVVTDFNQVFDVTQGVTLARGKNKIVKIVK